MKLSIKSFKVPELFIEIPTTTTVGSLKRTVMEAITAILGDGLHVGIFSKERRLEIITKLCSRLESLKMINIVIWVSCWSLDMQK